MPAAVGNWQRVEEAAGGLVGGVLGGGLEEGVVSVDVGNGFKHGKISVKVGNGEDYELVMSLQWAKAMDDIGLGENGRRGGVIDGAA